MSLNGDSNMSIWVTAFVYDCAEQIMDELKNEGGDRDDLHRAATVAKRSGHTLKNHVAELITTL